MDIDSIIQNARHIHFIGIGGSGMFPLVQILYKQGMKISGSDNNEGSIVDAERAMGIAVAMGQSAGNIKAGIDLAVYSAAIAADNPELVFARESGIPTIERSEMLGYITRQYSRCICVAGTHGKTTTTAMLTQILLDCGRDPSAVIGGKLPAIGGYGRAGGSDIMTCEACEFADTFLRLSPDIAVILNIDEDHLDHFGSLENIIASFRRFAENTDGPVILNGGDGNCLKMAHGLEKRMITFGIGAHHDYTAANIRMISPVCTAFDLVYRGETLCGLRVNVPGEHQVLNALAACAAAIETGVTPGEIAQAIPNFRGAGRRFEVLGEINGITVADDYAHHPLEIEVTLKAAAKMGYSAVWAVFQPFTYSRTAHMLDAFAKALSIADHVVMSKIMGGREQNTFGISTADLAARIPGCVWFEGFPEIADYILRHAKPGDLVITMGCGDIYKCANMMIAKYNHKKLPD
ncbi:MAG: UDP-N-acetylmuramate--L-alanine ligase [Oscillospiraceae bacterium]|nr:UDP-N-acetylmuramate--L-alanine ligase [Oscillospiraceae bacterium]